MRNVELDTAYKYWRKTHICDSHGHSDRKRVRRSSKTEIESIDSSYIHAQKHYLPGVCETGNEDNIIFPGHRPIRWLQQEAITFGNGEERENGECNAYRTQKRERARV